jgi:hypothetical protein
MQGRKKGKYLETVKEGGENLVIVWGYELKEFHETAADDGKSCAIISCYWRKT